MVEFCTYFDQRYLARGLALYASLARHCDSFRLWVLCLDDETFAVLGDLSLPDLRRISRSEFEAADPELAAARATRTTVEYYFTCTPRLPLHIFERAPEVESLTYLDADVYFYADPRPLLRRLSDKGVVLTPHSFGDYALETALFGRYNVGWLTFRRGPVAGALLSRCREQCIEWCYLRDEDGRFADQKYLDAWQAEPGVWVMDTPSVGLAPWNLANHRISLKDDALYVDGHPLVCFHFSSLVSVNPWIRDSNLPMFGVTPAGLLRSHLYRPYLEEMVAAEQRAASFGLQIRPLRTIHDFPPRRWAALAAVPFFGPALRELLHAWRGLARRGYFFTFNGRVL
jgi:hypothetical protein